MERRKRDEFELWLKKQLYTKTKKVGTRNWWEVDKTKRVESLNRQKAEEKLMIKMMIRDFRCWKKKFADVELKWIRDCFW